MLQIHEIGTISERIRQLVNHFCQGNKAAFGRAADIQSGVLAGIVGGRESKPGFEILQKLLTAYPSVNADWLIFGRGSMLIDSTDYTTEATGTNQPTREQIEQALTLIAKTEAMDKEIAYTKAFMIEYAESVRPGLAKEIEARVAARSIADEAESQANRN